MADWPHFYHDTADLPPWGTLGLDVFLPQNWQPDANVSAHEQAVRLVREYAASSTLSRSPYLQTAETTPPQPSPEQIFQILEPSRAPVLRSVANQVLRQDEIWLRIDYSSEDAHAALCESLQNIDAGENLSEDCLRLSDVWYYDFGSEGERVLDILAELLDMNPDLPKTAENYRMGNFRRRKEHEYADNASEDVLAQQQHCCVAGMLFIEDNETHSTDVAEKRLRSVWLDDFGNVVRETRVTLQEACDYLSIVGEGMGAEDAIWLGAYIGPKYVHGAEFGPPFSMKRATDKQ